jgi:hypothetical protein
VLDYNLLFMLFSFVDGAGLIYPGAVLHYVPRGICRGVVCDAGCSPVGSAG